MPKEVGNFIEVDGHSLESRWNRVLIVISIPHGAAFGSFYGKYDFSFQGGDSYSQIYCTFMMMSMLPLVTLWLLLVHDLLRNAFLRQGHAGSWLKIKHSFLYSCAFLAPLLLLLLSRFEAGTENRAAILGLFWVLFSWCFCAVLFSNSMYLNAVKALGIKVDD